MEKTALVTGAGGFIGSHLVERLLSLNYKVRALTWYHPNGSHGWLDISPLLSSPRLELILGDIRDSQHVAKLLEGIQEVYHLAALISIPHSYQEPESFFQTNLMGTLNLLQACRNHPVEKILLVSSSEVYGTARFTPITESHPLQAQSPYSASKIAKEKLAESFIHSYQLPISIVRPFNTYGPRQSLRALIPSLILQLLAGKEEILLGNIKPTRDWLYVPDTVEALIQIASEKDTVGKVLNIASGRECSVGEMAQTLIKLLNPQAMVVQDPKRIRPDSSEVYRLCGSSSLLQSITPWRPAYTLEAGLTETMKWFREHQQLPAYQNLSYRI